MIITHKEKRWAIVGKYGLYVGQYLSRRDAIEGHTKMIGQSWRKCHKRGDRFVKVIITWEAKE